MCRDPTGCSRSLRLTSFDLGDKRDGGKEWVKKDTRDRITTVV